MNQMDLANLFKSGYSLSPQQITATTNGTAVDFQDCEDEVTSVIQVGANPGNDTTIDVTLQESSDNSTFTAVAGTGDSHTQIVGDQVNQLEMVTSFIRTKRYVRQLWTITGTSPTPMCSGMLMARKKSF
jgi:hypothetical protein